jgi:hypothetical protein
LTGECGYKAEERGPGIYYIHGGLVPIQIIISKDLNEGDNLWLKNLGREISAVSLSKILEKSREMSVGAYLGVLLEANPEQLREVLEMGDGRVSIEEVLVETGWAAKFESRGERLGEKPEEKLGERPKARQK